MIKIIGITVVCLILSLMMTKKSAVFSTLICAFGAVIIFTYVLSQLTGVFDFFNDLQDKVSTSGAFISLMMKILGISIITQIICDICRDSGKTSLATQAEIASKIAVMTMLLPLFEAVINIVSGLTK